MAVCQTILPVRASSAYTRASVVVRNNLFIVNRQGARGAVGAGGFRTKSSLPDQVASAAIDRLESVAGVGEIDDSVVDDGRGLISSAVVHGPHPCQLQTRHVLGRDLCQSAVAPSLIIAA